MTSSWNQEIQQGERFAFGRNWKQFLNILNNSRIEEAKKSLQKMLSVDSLQEKTFLDIGCGSGLFSLAARMLGAKVYSFDFDPDSVSCTKKLKAHYFSDDKDWEISQGSVLDKPYLDALGQFDVVYSWGVLHHTGSMWKAIENASVCVKPGGYFYIAIYNEQPFLSKYWVAVKKLYNKAPLIIKKLMQGMYSAYFMSGFFVADMLRGKNPALRYHGKEKRGMSVYRDVCDWIGGWPFEVATPEAIFYYLKDKKFMLMKLKTCAGKHGCNEFVFQKCVK